MIKLVDVRLDVATGTDQLSFSANFGPGVNVINAPNSWGKSTLLQSIIFALGLEGMFSASRQAPLGEAMTRVADGPYGRASVVESSVTVTLQNSQGAVLRARRFAKSFDTAPTLVQTWSAASRSDLASAPQVDTIVREQGSAVREAGFHKVLADFLGWRLPTVPTFAGGEVPLYLELLFPLFYVEQKFGWSGVTPRVPTYLRVREPTRRAVEYILGLSTLERIKQRNALREELQDLNREWESAVHSGHQVAAAYGWHLIDVPDSPTGRSQRRAGRVLVQIDDGFIELSRARERWQSELDSLPEEEVPIAAERTETSRRQLDAAERELRRLGGEARSTQESINFTQADLDAVSSRLVAIDSDMRRFRDIRRLRTLGSTLDIPLLATNQCPTCEQDLDGRQVATGEVLSVEDSAALAEAERVTLLELQTSLQRRIDALQVAAVAASRSLAEWRERVRLLRDELAGPSVAPSYAEVANRLTVERRIDGADQVLTAIEDMSERLDRLSSQLDDVRARLAALGDADQSPEDLAILQEFRGRFRDQLAAYGLRSLPPAEVTIDDQTLLPANDGVELAFDVTTGMSASDTIRTKWAYYTALLETASLFDRSHHAGLLILDEPRQQETDRESLAAFLRRLGNVGQMREDAPQIIYATSERPEILSALLTEISFTPIPTPGQHLLS